MAECPAKIGKYKIESLVATGGMGAVYKAIHPTLNRFVIIKKLTLKDDDQIIQRFNREARIMMDFKNDNIVDVYDHFKEAGSYYIVLEYVDGIALDSLIKKEGKISNELALYIVLEIAKALKYAHSKGVVHRDVKPANILISKKGDIKLVDFGIAVSDENSDEDLTTVGMTLGTPSYMAPEQFENTKNVDKRADIYSLGVILYEMVTGAKPFPSGLSPSCIALIQKGKYKKAKKINKLVSNKITFYIKKLMHNRVNKRAQDLDRTVSSLDRYFRKERFQIYKDRLSSSVTGTFVKDIPVRKNRFFIIPLTLTILVVVATYIFIEMGFQYEIIPSKSYGAININLRVNKNYYKEIDEIFIQSKMFYEDGAELIYLGDSNYDFIPSDMEDKIYHIYKTGKIYLPVGFYRLKLMVDGNLFWKNINVISRKEQRSNEALSSGQLITLTHVESEPLPFHPQFTISDLQTGENITSSSTILIKKGKVFEKFSPVGNNLVTGQVHYFQITKKGYYPKDFILKISHDQTDLKLDAGLFPKPGKVNIKSNTSGIKLSINGRDKYVKGDRSEESVKIEKINLDNRSFILSPGDYLFSFVYKGNRIEERVILKSEDIYNIFINYNKETKSLSILR